MPAATVAPARRAAFQILLAMERDRLARSDELLHTGQIDGLAMADRRLATALTLGVLRWQLVLDARIARLLRRAAKLDDAVQVALRLGAFQILFMDRIPARAAIHDSVELTKQAGHRFASGMVNAVLRRLAAEPRGDADPAAAHPPWMVERWRAAFGPEAAAAICAHDQQPPPLALRPADAEAEAEIVRAGVEPGPGLMLAAARRVLGGEARLYESAALKSGRVRIQDEASQLVAELAGEGRRILDVCAAPGGKTAILAERNPGAEIVACDISAARLEVMRTLLAGTAAAGRVKMVVADASRLDESQEVSGLFDLILCDAPCSGTGTLARNPEVKLRLRPEDLARQAERQRAILAAALRRLAPGGRLLYSTCSLEAEENEAVVRQCLQENRAVGLVPIAECVARLAEQGRLATGSGERAAGVIAGEFLRTLPGQFDGDGFFAAMIARNDLASAG
jgi:16S rRNA (cytosine967-C5)-methyltransferase